MPYEDYFKEASASATLEEKIEIIKHNNKQALNIRREISLWQEGSFQVINPPISVKKEDVSQRIIKNETDTETSKLADKISLLDISDIPLLEALEQIRKIIGSSLNEITINKIKLLLYKEYIIYNRMLLEASSKEEVESLETAIASVKLKLELLEELEDLEGEQELEEEITTTNNHFFFLLSDAGKVVALESLRKSVPREYYPAFKELLLGLKKGKAKGLKKLREYNYLQLKDFKIRIIFDKLSNGNYVIIDCFMKKVDTGISYRNNLANRCSQYQRKREYFLSHYKEEDFKKENEEYFTEIMNLLDSKVLEGERENVARTL